MQYSMSTEEYIALVYRNLKGELSSNEFELLNNLTAKDTSMSNLRLEIEETWDMSGKLDQLVTLDETNQLAASIIDDKSIIIDTQQKPLDNRFNWKRIILKIAAILIILLAAVWVMRDQVVTYDTAGRYTLADNSIVELRGKSILKVFPFNSQSRNISLEGEAFFEVVKDSQRPFIINTQDTETEVLGTSFLIKETLDNTYIEVQTGKVNFSSKVNESEMILTSGMKAIHSLKDIKAIEGYDNLSGWRQGIYQYKDAKLSMILDELKIIFDVDIVITNPSLLDCSFSAILTADNIEDVLDQIASSLEIQVESDDTKWKLSGGKCK